MLATCALYGGTTYTNSWISINLLVILTSLLVISVIYSLSSFLPGETKAKLKGVARFEFIQAIISALIIAILVGSALSLCTISSTVSNQLTGTSRDPFQYATYYIGSLSLNTGLTLLSHIYASSINYAVTGTVLQSYGNLAYQLLIGPAFSANKVFQFFVGKNFQGSVGPFGVGFSRDNFDLSQMFFFLSTMYLGVFSPIVLLAVGLLFIQFLMLPLMEYTAFTVILPAAIAMRSLAFTSSSVASAANSLLTIAIAMYLIYPATVAFDSYAIGYIFSPTNPSARFLATTYTANTISPFSYLAAAPQPNAGNNFVSQIFYTSQFVVKAFQSAPTNPITGLFTVTTTFRHDINQMAQFILVSVLLFVLNISITIVLSLSMYKALKSTLGEGTRFW